MADPWEDVNAYLAASISDVKLQRAEVQLERERAGLTRDQQREQDRQADRQMRLDAQAQARAQKAQREAEANAPRTLSDRLSDRRVLVAVRGLNNRLIKPAGDRARRAPTPGGIGLLLFALIIFLFAIIAVNGTHTRLELIWLTLLGKTSVPRAPGDSNDATRSQAVVAATADVIGQTLGIPGGTNGASVGAAFGVIGGVINGVTGIGG